MRYWFTIGTIIHVNFASLKVGFSCDRKHFPINQLKFTQVFFAVGMSELRKFRFIV